MTKQWQAEKRETMWKCVHCSLLNSIISYVVIRNHWRSHCMCLGVCVCVCVAFEFMLVDTWADGWWWRDDTVDVRRAMSVRKALLCVVGSGLMPLCVSKGIKDENMIEQFAATKHNTKLCALEWASWFARTAEQPCAAHIERFRVQTIQYNLIQVETEQFRWWLVMALNQFLHGPLFARTHSWMNKYACYVVIVIVNMYKYM